MSTQKKTVDVCIVGGGPAGLVLGLLLARLGVKVLVLEKNKDFAREYRGEVLMPRFMQMFHQLNLDEWVLTLPHLKLKHGEIHFKDKLIGNFDFATPAPDFPYALWMPQPVLLEGLFKKASTFASFEMWFDASVKHLIQDNGVQGVTVQHAGQEVEVLAKVTVGADGRFSTLVREGKFELDYEDHKFDVLWFTIPKPKDYENTFKVLLSTKRNYLLLPKFPDAIQVGILVDPRGIEEFRGDGLSGLKEDLRTASPLFKEFADNLKDLTPFHPLQARLYFMKEWAKDGCLLIGDAAHCCSPAGAIGVSIAVGTAIVAADVISKALKSNSASILTKEALSQVQKQREKEIREIHRLQSRLAGGPLAAILPVRWVLPFMVTLLSKTPLFRRLQKTLMTLPNPLPISKEIVF